ncbi:hypothetical protein SESBI_07504 [Sesbania bispinosa]|nr:hypothetical protein SESBI_07504 [Sesbania bispinosa]
MGPFKSKSIIEGPNRNVASRIRRWDFHGKCIDEGIESRPSLVNVGPVTGNEEPEIDLDLAMPSASCLHEIPSWVGCSSLSGGLGFERRFGKGAKEKAEKSRSVLKTEVKKLRKDLAMRTAEAEAAKKEAEELRARKEQMQKTKNSSVGMDRQVVAALIKNNLARHQAKWEEEKARLLDIGNNMAKESFDNALAQLSLRNPDFIWMGAYGGPQAIQHGLRGGGDRLGRVGGVSQGLRWWLLLKFSYV